MMILSSVCSVIHTFPAQCYECDSAIDGVEACSADDNSPAVGNLKECPPEENKGCYIVEGKKR